MVALAYCLRGYLGLRPQKSDAVEDIDLHASSAAGRDRIAIHDFACSLQESLVLLLKRFKLVLDC